MGGGFDGQLAQGGEREVDRGRGQVAIYQVRAVALDEGPGEAFARGMLLVPAKKLTERPAVGAAAALPFPSRACIRPCEDGSCI